MIGWVSLLIHCMNMNLSRADTLATFFSLTKLSDQMDRNKISEMSRRLVATASEELSVTMSVLF